MKYITIKGYEDYPCTVYADGGRFFIDYHATDKNGHPLPIHSYSTITAVKEALYYHFN